MLGLNKIVEMPQHCDIAACPTSKIPTQQTPFNSLEVKFHHVKGNTPDYTNQS